MKAFVRLYTNLLLTNPWLVLILSLAVGSFFVFQATSLEFDARFHALLPDDTPELLEVEEVQKKAGGTVELVIALEGKDYDKKLAVGRKIAAALDAKKWIQRADVEWPIEFFLDRRLMLMGTDSLKKLQQAIDDEIERAKARANPLYVDLEDEEDQPKPWSEVDKKDSPHKDAMLRRTFTDPDDKYLFVRVKPMGSSFDLTMGEDLLGSIKATVNAQHPEKYGVKVRYAGNLEENQEQHEVMGSDFKRAALIALVSILLLMTLYVRRISAPLVLAIPLIIGVGATLGITALTFGKLNLVSGMLVSALFGLGIDFEIHLYLRYLEELTPGGDRKEAMREAILKTMPGCITAGTTTAAAFFAMAISDFKGYREYGLIAGMGVLVTLAFTFLVLPPLALLLCRKGRKPRQSAAVGNLPRRMAWAMALTGGGALIYCAIIAPQVKWYNDFKALRGNSEKVNFSYYVGDLLGGSLSPAAVLVQDLDQAKKVHDYLEPKVDTKKFAVKRVLSLYSMVPKDRDKKQPILDNIAASLEEVLEEKLEPGDRKRVEDALKLARIKPWGVKDIPDVFRKQFLTLDGKEQFVVLWPAFPTHVDRKVIAWGQALNKIHKDLRAMGIPVKILDENRIGARVLSEMREDAPIVFFGAGLAVLLLLFLDFRKPTRVLLVAGALGVGIVWMLGVMVIRELWINVFNQAVLATIIGVGIDNVVHIEHRYLEEGKGSVVKVMATTGSAAFLASLTTAIGFGATITAHHLGINSLGWLSIVGLSCTFVASTIFFPAVLRLLER